MEAIKVKKIRTLLYIATLLMLVISASADDGFSKAVPVDNDQPVISTVSLHPDGKLLVTAGDDHVVRVWLRMRQQLDCCLRRS